MARAGLTVSVDGFADGLMSIVERYMTDITKDTQKAVKAAGQTVIDEIQATGAFHDGSGEYRSGWRQKVEGSRVDGYTTTVYNAKKPGLAHLLENGHGGPAPAPPHPHIAQAYEEGVKTLERELKKAIG